MSARDWSCGVLVFGGPGHGKSVLMAEELRGFARDGYVFVHDSARTFAGSDVLVHETRAEVDAALKAGCGAALHCLPWRNGIAALRYAERVAAKARAAFGEGKVRVLFAIDEPTTFYGPALKEGAEVLDNPQAEGTRALSASYAHPLLVEAWAQRRHKGLGLYIGAQRVTMVHRDLREIPSRVVAFRTPDGGGEVDALRDTTMPTDMLRRVTQLPRFWHPAAAEKPENLRQLPASVPLSRRLADCYVDYRR